VTLQLKIFPFKTTYFKGRSLTGFFSTQNTTYKRATAVSKNAHGYVRADFFIFPSCSNDSS